MSEIRPLGGLFVALAVSTLALSGMLQTISNFVDEYLIADSLKRDPFVVKRARLLAWLHVIATSLSLGLMLASVLAPAAFTPQLVALTFALVALTALYAKQGNIILSGNLIVVVTAIALVLNMRETGGLYSDNLVWSIILPIVAFLFTSRVYGIAWSIFVLCLLTAFYVLEVNSEVSYRYASLMLGAEYFFVSYLGLFTGIFGIVLLFVRGNDEILYSLRRASAALRDRKQTVESQNERLLTQEQDLKRSNRDLELFAYVASHDLKEPLRMVTAYSQIVQRNLGPAASLKDQEYLGYVREGAERMQTMLDDLLAYSRLGKERDAVEAVDLNRVMVLVQNNLRVRLEETAGELLFDSLPTVSGRRTHFVQVFQNLIANSLKFSRPGTPPRVRITTRRDEGADEFVIAVEDNGIGIRAEDIDSIFGVFQRLHSRDEYEGSGIGLATVQRIIDGLGGRITVSSVYGEGTTFQLSLPLKLVSEAAPTRPTPAA